MMVLVEMLSVEVTEIVWVVGQETAAEEAVATSGSRH